MTRDNASGDSSWFFTNASNVYPHPVAAVCGRIIRSRSHQEKLDAVLRAAEVLTRYLAAASLASYAARDPEDAQTKKLSPLSGNLAFGHFLTVVQEVAASTADHPLKKFLDAGFKPRKDGKKRRPGPTDEALTALVKLRNDLGHDLLSITGARAQVILQEHSPEQVLVAALDGLYRLLALPLFVVEEQRFIKKAVRARVLLLMGESVDPAPEEMEFQAPLGNDDVPYIGTAGLAIPLHPLVAWGLVVERSNYRLIFADGISDTAIRYKTIGAEIVDRDEETVKLLRALVNGTLQPAEPLTLSSGESLGKEWSRRRKSIEEIAQHQAGFIPWDELDAGTLAWYASRLPPETGAADPSTVITEYLLDGRDRLQPDEVRQLILLFGSQKTIRQELRRDLIDLRHVPNSAERWNERLVEDQNVLQCLILAVDFFSRHLDIKNSTVETLTSTTGSADYIAMREALINLFIHQDYGETSAAAQVEIRPESAMFFNPGHSLVETAGLIEGGRSQARNPLIARALRLIGFAELAGSGLRALQATWRHERRRPPRFESNRKANTFGLTLDWRGIPDTYNSFWKDRIGAKLSEAQAQVLNLASDARGIDVAEAASAAGATMEEASEILAYLARQVLVTERKGRYFIQDHLKELVTDT